MTAPTPPIPDAVTDGSFLPQGFVNALLSLIAQLYTYLLGGFRTRKPYMLAHTSAVQGITEATMLWQVCEEQSDAIFPTSDGTLGTSVLTSTQAFTIRTPGLYDIASRVHFAAGSSTGGVCAGILLNGSDSSYLVDSSGVVADRNDGVGPAAFTSKTLRLAAGSVIRIYAWQDTGASRNTTLSWGGSWVSIEWISP